MRTRFINTNARKCVSVSGSKCVRFSNPERAKLWSIFLGSVCLAVGLNTKLANECVSELSAMGQNVKKVELV